MKNLIIIAFALLSLPAMAQEKGPKKGDQLTIGSGGIRVTHKGDSTQKAFELQIGMLDLGVNSLQDKTNYQSAEAQNFLKVSPEAKNSNLFALRDMKSVNVNIYPVLVKFNALRTRNQKILISTGLGLQIYNFRFNKPISFINTTEPAVIMDTVSFSKNKLAVTYLTVPLMVTAKTRLADKTWLVYGAGISAGYRLSSWTKQISDERGKQKNRDRFNLSDYNVCVNGEVGLEGYIRLYASYQLTNMFDNGLDQHPFSIGVRFLGL
jgi:hypothetical protein